MEEFWKELRDYEERERERERERVCVFKDPALLLDILH
jgi:hypothetical protein